MVYLRLTLNFYFLLHVELHLTRKYDLAGLALEDICGTENPLS